MVLGEDRKRLTSAEVGVYDLESKAVAITQRSTGNGLCGTQVLSARRHVAALKLQAFWDTFHVFLFGMLVEAHKTVIHLYAYRKVQEMWNSMKNVQNIQIFWKESTKMFCRDWKPTWKMRANKTKMRRENG